MTYIDIFKKRYTNGQETYEKVLDITNDQGYANQTTMRYHHTPSRMATIKKSKNNRCRCGCSERVTLIHCWWECKLVQLLWKTIGRFLK